MKLKLKIPQSSFLIGISLAFSGQVMAGNEAFEIINPLETDMVPEYATLVAQQANVTIRGSVLDGKTKEPLIGVNVFEKGTTNGTITDLDGNYSLQVSGENAIIVFSCLGYVPRELTPGKATSLDVALQEDAKVLNEVVVVSYGTQKKRALTGSVSTLNTDDVSDLPVAQLAQKVQGQIPGVHVVQQSGTPGQGMSFKIRGAVSMNSSIEPLFVVDGMPLSTGLNNLNPDDIESFTVLKDAAASS
ncbi:MAG: carboxypeptidase-like regulatory domain-containing protein, partial [Tannerellaceae bacterium]|nr:carboxypeptidase-like regulatory domain-containing protein [Tannerellaceae bacterium]